MNSPTEAQLAAVRDSHPGVSLHQWESLGHTVIARLPNRVTWKRFRQQMQDENRRIDAQEKLLREHIVWPELGTFDAWVEAKPGLLDTFAVTLVQECGFGADVEKKAL